MKYRNIITQKLEAVEGGIKALSFMVNNARPVKEFEEKLSKLDEIIKEVKDIVEREPFASNEINKLK